jgi:DNA-binding CsgD family transcriptional regulator
VAGTSRNTFVGRDAELAQLTALLDDAAAGRPVVALVSGDAGVGKTRLVAELAAMAAGRGFAVLAGRCAELADAVPYLPLADALHRATADPAAAGPLQEALAARPVLSRLLPDPAIGQQPAEDTPGLVQQQLFGAVIGMLTDLAAASPVLLVLEDLHWADRSTRDLVTFLSRMLHRERIALLASYRTDDLHRRHPLRPLIAELDRLPSVTIIDLGPLPAAAMAQHLTELADRQLAASELDRMISRAEGNAYYAEELLASAQSPADCGHDAGGTSLDGGVAGAAADAALPISLANLLLSRLERLSPAAQRVMRTAAVAGRRVDDGLVRAASGLSGPEYDDALREAIAHQLLVPDGTQGYTFRHALLREAIYNDLLPGERTRLHARLAELLDDENRPAGLAGTAAELAHHYLASHDIPGAFAASIRAAQDAARRAAPGDAHHHYDLALSLWERVDDPQRLGGIGRGELAFRSAISSADSGSASRAIQQLRRLLDYLGKDADPALYCRASERLAYFLLDANDDEAAIAAAEAAVAALPAAPPRWERARALATLARALLSLKDDGPARARAEEASAAARAARAPWIGADALVTLGQLAERAGRVAEAVSMLGRAHQQARGAGKLGAELRAAFAAARIELEQGDLRGAAQVAHQGVRRAEETGLLLAPYGYDLQYLHYLAHYAEGDWDHAQEIADAFTIRVSSPPEARLSAMALFIDVARGRPTVADRRTWLVPFWPDDRFSEYIGRGLLGEHAMWQGDEEEALTQVDAAIAADLQASGGYVPSMIRPAAIGLAVLGDRARRARAGGDAERARAAVKRARGLVEVAREGATSWRPQFRLGVDGRGWLARAEAEWRRAQGDNDPTHWEAVVAEFAPAFVYETARSRWRLAEALAESGDRDGAQRQWRRAAEVADRLGAAPLRAALASLARRARLEASPPGRGAGQAGGRVARSPLAALTGRELEVLRLVAAGQSNREIARELFIAPKTASVHVSNILAKLGAATRTEAAAIAYREGIGLPGSAPR